MDTKTKWIILNTRLKPLNGKEYNTAAEAQTALEKKYPNPFARQQFFVAEKDRYNY